MGAFNRQLKMYKRQPISSYLPGIIKPKDLPFVISADWAPVVDAGTANRPSSPAHIAHGDDTLNIWRFKFTVGLYRSFPWIGSSWNIWIIAISSLHRHCESASVKWHGEIIHARAQIHGRIHDAISCISSIKAQATISCKSPNIIIYHWPDCKTFIVNFIFRVA